MSGVRPILQIISFGYRYDDPPVANALHDMRWMPDPFDRPELRDLSGLDRPVQEWLFGRPETEVWFDAVLYSLDPLVCAVGESGAVTIAFGCQGGSMRSVAVAERFAEVFRRAELAVSVHHRDLHHRGGRAVSSGGR